MKIIHSAESSWILRLNDFPLASLFLRWAEQSRLLVVCYLKKFCFFTSAVKNAVVKNAHTKMQCHPYQSCLILFRTCLTWGPSAILGLAYSTCSATTPRPRSLHKEPLSARGNNCYFMLSIYSTC